MNAVVAESAERKAELQREDAKGSKREWGGGGWGCGDGGGREQAGEDSEQVGR